VKMQAHFQDREHITTYGRLMLISGKSLR